MEIIENKAEILDQVREILGSRKDSFYNLIVILQDIQKRFRYIPKIAMAEVAKHLNISQANVYGVATFYNQFRFQPPGKYHIRMCMGTACHVKSGDKVLDQWKRRLEIEEGGRTPDGEYSLERVACVGCCSIAPVTVINDDVIGDMAPNRVDGILLQHKIQKEKEMRAAKSQTEPNGLEDEETRIGGKE